MSLDSPRDRLDRLVMVVPTYNEAANLESVLGRLRTSVPAADVLVVDDSSPDGTGDIASALAEADPQVHVLHRDRKTGLGAAYLAGFRWALERDYDVIGEMDADGSHQPEELPRLLAGMREAGGADLVIGSRWVAGGSIVNWPRRREWLSRGGNAYTRTLLGVGIRDMTAGFRLYRRTTLETIDLDSVASLGYVFQADLAFRTVRAGLSVLELPIRFVEREHGESKMSREVAVESLKRITSWGLRQRRSQLLSGRRNNPPQPSVVHGEED
jgi:dolichol-phosphate mannosyltransferase